MYIYNPESRSYCHVSVTFIGSVVSQFDKDHFDANDEMNEMIRNTVLFA